jgi:acyl-CoA hydrolase
VPVPPWQPTTEEDRHLQEAAIRRIQVRRNIEAAMKLQTYSNAGTAPETMLRFLAAATDVNWGGKVHGGTVMRWIDEVAYVCGVGWSGTECVAVYAGGVRLTTHCLSVFVALDGSRQARPVRRWEPRSDEDLALEKHALQLMEVRGNAPPWN